MTAQGRIEQARRVGVPLVDYQGSGSFLDGPLFEAGFLAWLSDLEIPAKMNGGVNSLPDFEVCGERVGLKCRSVKKPPFRPEWEVNVPERHVGRDEDWIAFGALEPNRMMLLGFMRNADFRATARRIETGQPMHQGLPAVAETTRTIRASQLVAPRAWLGERD